MTLERLLPSVCSLMVKPLGALREQLIAIAAMEWFLSSVYANVVLKAYLQSELFWTEVTFEHLACMNPSVVLQVSFLGKALLTEVALEWFLACVGPHVQFEISLLAE